MTHAHSVGGAPLLKPVLDQMQGSGDDLTTISAICQIESGLSALRNRWSKLSPVAKGQVRRLRNDFGTLPSAP